MRRSYLKILAGSTLLAALFSCSKSLDDNSSAACTVIYTDSQPILSDQSVQYNAGVEGKGGTISSVSYLDSAGTTVVNNPALPWTKKVNLKKGAMPSITAIGTAYKGGQVNVSAFADGVQSGSSCIN